MDPRFLKWMGETLSLYAANLEASNKTGSMVGIEESEWSKVGKYLPAIPPPLCSVDEMDECYRQWLSFLGAIPRSDLEALQRKLTALEEECDQLKESLDMLVKGLSGTQDIPAAIKQWVDLAKTITALHREWLKDFRSQPDEPEERKAKKLEGI